MLTNGTQLGPYEIVAHIGAGGMGDVYKARDTRLSRFVALKTSRQRYSERFDREMRAIASLSHPNVCALYDVGPDYLVMELLEGQTLAQVLHTRRLSVEEAVRIAAQIAEALHTAHAKGITHRDIKPGNVFISPRGYVKVLDFGLAKMAADAASAPETLETAADPSTAGVAMGTVAYMAPEQARGEEIDARADLWSLGVVFYEMLTNSRPFDGATTAVVFDAIFHQTPRPCGASPETDQIVAKLLAKDRSLRYQSAADVSADLKRVEKSSGMTVSFQPAGAKRSRWMWPAVAVFALAAGGVWYWKTSGGPKNVLGEKSVLVVADFVNKTGDPVFDGTLREALTTKLQQSDVLLAMSPGQIRGLLAEMRLTPETALTPEIATQVCLRAGEKATLTGTISALGTAYVIQLTTMACQTGEALASARAEADGKEKVLAALDKATDELREKLGDQLAAANRPGRSVPLAMTTASIDAFQAYTKGLEQFRKGQWDAAIPGFRRARELDPEFAMAWYSEGTAHSNAGRPDLGDPLFEKGFALREHASTIERLFIEGAYYSSRDPDRARLALEEMLSLVPNSALGRSLLANIYVRQGEWEHAIEVRKRQIQADPSYMLGYAGLIRDYTDLDRFADAHEIADLPIPKQSNAPFLQMVLLRLAYVEGNLTEAERIWSEMQRSEPLQGAPVKLSYVVSLGRFAEASQFVRLMRDLGDRSGSRSAWTAAVTSLRMERALAGDCGFLKETGDGVVSAETLLYCGEHVRAAKQAEELAARPGMSTDAMAQARAVAALAKRQPQQAIDALEPLRRGDSQTTNPLLRGMAYMELKRPAEASTEFGKLMARQSQKLDAGYAAAHVLRARALVATGDRAEAKKSYDAFFALWKTSDAGVPLLEAARKEYAALQ